MNGLYSGRPWCQCAKLSYLPLLFVSANFLDMDGRYIMSIMTLIVIGYIAQLKTYSFIKTLILALSETPSPSQGYAI